MVFKPELGRINEVEAKLTSMLRPDKPRSVYRMTFARKWSRSVTGWRKQASLSPTQHSDWPAPIVPVVKTNGSVRICGDYKLTVNIATKTEPYPLPLIEDLFPSLAGRKVFSKLDLSRTYLQLVVSEESQPLLTVNTHKAVPLSEAPIWSFFGTCHLEQWRPYWKACTVCVCVP